MGTPGQPALADALKQLWVKFLPQIEERVTVIEDANRALAAGTLTEADRAAAHSAAHKLAGVLGTFGLAEGTDLARKAEDIYAGETAIDPDAITRLEAIAQSLSLTIRSHG
jgi:HPt (histidine-containing phosphotransfer) domain-containing protein